MKTPEAEYRAAMQRLLETAERAGWPRALTIRAVERLMLEAGR